MSGDVPVFQLNVHLQIVFPGEVLMATRTPVHLSPVRGRVVPLVGHPFPAYSTTE